jgi:hypothetical protein
MARYVVDARTLLHIVSAGVRIHPDHRLVAPNPVRSQALSLLYDEVRRGRLAEALITIDDSLAHKADGIVPVKPLNALTST